ncbi:ATP-binding protein [Streptomyces sp. NBC_01235]|uniref:ATP-binding protein n=1 Tax=Streptomyces sp. NBC_01235 TaxID=2903788 RepID=UPI002E0F3644|nr:ATP-binding protein [Streptomyces sp. NBC_01235]
MITPSPTTSPALIPASAPAHHFRIQLSSTRRGARLARLLVEQQLEEWGIPRTVPVTRALVAITAELAANAVTHGRTPGRDFEVRLSLTATQVRVEVSDTRPDRLLPLPDGTTAATSPPPDTAANGRGLLLVDAFATHWGCEPRNKFVKTVWAEVSL